MTSNGRFWRKRSADVSLQADEVSAGPAEHVVVTHFALMLSGIRGGSR